MSNVNSTNETLRFRYKNYKGEVADRSVIPIRIVVKNSKYHNEGKPCWIMVAFDLDKEADEIEKAVKLALKDGYRTKDIMSEGNQLVGCSEMGTILAGYIK